MLVDGDAPLASAADGDGRSVDEREDGSDAHDNDDDAYGGEDDDDADDKDDDVKEDEENYCGGSDPNEENKY